MNLNERIAEALRFSGKSATQVASEAGVSDSAISQLLSGRTKSLRAETAVKIASATGISPSWLVSGQGVMLGTSGSLVEPLLKASSSKGIKVPMLANIASMGAGADLQEDDALSGDLVLTEQFVRDSIKPSRPDSLRFIHAYGDSMAPTFQSGDILLVDTGVVDAKIDGVYVLRAHERMFVKRVRQRLDGQFEISSDNPAHKTVDILNGEHEVTVIGRVLWAWNGRRM